MLPEKAEINGARNGTFLILNVGNNTFQFGSSSAFPESSRDLIVPATDTISTSTEEGSPGSQSCKRASKQRDPDWVPENNRVRKSGRRPTANSNSSEKSPGPLVISSNPSEVSQGNASNAPPDYLVTLLGYSNWKVEFWPSSGTYVYVSPTGQPYSSPVKAYEAFLLSMSSSKGKAPAPFQPLGCNWFGSGVNGLQGEIVKKGRGPARKRRSPVWPIGVPVVIDVESSQEVNPVASSWKKKEKTTIVEGREFNQMSSTGGGNHNSTGSAAVKSNGARISSYGNVGALGIDKSRMSLNIKWIGTRRRRSRRPLGSMQSGSILGKSLVPAEEKHEARKLVSMNNRHAGNQEIRVRRSGRIKGKHVVVDDRPDAQLQSGSGYLDLFRLAPNIPPVPVDAQLNQANMNAMKPPAATNQKPRRNGGCGLSIRRERKNDHQEETVSAPTKICMLTWLLGYGILAEREMITYITKNSTNKVCRGLVTGGNVKCECCDVVMPLLKFQAHVIGDSNVNRPWADMYLQSGKTLIDCLSEAWGKVKGEKRIGFQMVGTEGPDPSDDTCGVCADGGHLICCDGCPSTFHQDCVNLKTLPEGSWYCPYCRCSFCMVGDHGSGNGHETFPLLKCKQCGCKYHRNCAWKRVMHDMWEETYSFCGKNCKKIADQLSGILGIPHPLEGGFSWSLLKRLNEDEGDSSGGKFSFIMECNAKLSMAYTVLDECFATLKDQRTGLDMICQAVYNCGSNFNRLNYDGFYTLVLEKDEEIVSAATLRFHGRKLAEMPFIGTRPVFRMQGMCRRLLKAIEDMLSSLLVEKLIIPAIPDLLETWRTSFSFKSLESSHKEEIRNLSMVIFPFTTVLQKSICNNGTTEQEGNVASGTVSSICFQANGMRADNSVDQRMPREEANELPQSYNENTCIGVNFARGQDWCGQKKDVTINPCKMTSNSIFAPGLLNPSCSFMGKKDGTPESYKIPSFLRPSCNFLEQKNATPESYKNITESSSFRNLPNARFPKVPRESTLETSAINNTYIPSLNMLPRNHTTKAFSFPSVNVDQNNDCQSVRTPASTIGHRNTWLRSRGDRGDG